MNELNVRNDVVTSVVVHCKGKKKRGGKKNRQIQKKLKIPESEISQCAEYKMKWQNRKNVCKQKNT